MRSREIRTNTRYNGVFRTVDGRLVPVVTAAQMREVDRIAVEDVGLGLLQMMENAGRSLAGNVMAMLTREESEIVILAGSGGNGGGGICCARHLSNRGHKVALLLSRDPSELRGAAAHQLRILQAGGLEPADPRDARAVIRGSQLVVDALIGYSLRGSPRGRVAELIELCNEEAARTLSLDVPSGLDATTGEKPGAVVQADRTLTLALPKSGLHGTRGQLFLADIGIPGEVYERLGISFEWPAGPRYWVEIEAI